MSWMSALPIISNLIDAGRDWAARRQEVKMAKQEQKLKQIEAKGELEVAKLQASAQREMTVTNAEIKLEQTAMENTRHSWKDEYALIWLTSLATGYFIPWTQPYVINGFEQMGTTMPQWFEWVLGIALCVSLGITQVKRFAPLIQKRS